MSKSERIKEKLDEIEKQLETISNNIGIKQPEVDENEINKYLNYDSYSLSKLTSSELNYISYKILNYSLYVKQQLNLLESIKVWVSAKLREIVSKTIGQFKGVSWSYSEQLAINNDEWAILLNEKLTEINMNINMYNDIVNILQLFSKKIDNMAFASRKETL